VQHYGPGGESPREILAVVSKRVQELVALQHHVLITEILPALASPEIRATPSASRALTMATTSGSSISTPR
jgi:hypothetical protein